MTIIKLSLPALLLLMLFSCDQAGNDTTVMITKELPYRAYAVQKDDGDKQWGYIIEYNHRLIIKQFSIPAVAGEQHFKTPEQAAAVGSFVAGKLNHALRPTISKAELDSMGIIQLPHVTQTK